METFEVCISGDIHHRTDHGPEQPAVVDPALDRREE